MTLFFFCPKPSLGAQIVDDVTFCVKTVAHSEARGLLFGIV